MIAGVDHTIMYRWTAPTMGAAVVERPRRERIDPFLSQAGQPGARDFPGRSTGVGGRLEKPPLRWARKVSAYI